VPFFCAAVRSLKAYRLRRCTAHEAHLAPSQPPSPPLLLLAGPAEVAVVSRAGREYDDWKLSNQDCHLVLPLPSTCGLATAASSDEEEPVVAEQQPRAVALGVFDGHGIMGTAASRYTRQYIATGLLRSHWRHVEGSCEGSGSSGSQDGSTWGAGPSWDRPAAAGEGSAEAAQQLLEAAFECAGAGILSSGLELRESGSTAVVCHVEPGRVTAAWCGDSRAVLGLHVERPDVGPALLVHPLTEDHRPDRPLERARVEAAGGQVVQLSHDSAGNPLGPFRLCGSNLYMAPRPMVSRAFGDTNAVEWGLTHTPDLVSVEFPVAASSGGSDSATPSSTMPAQAAANSSDTGNASEAGQRHVLILGSDGFFDTTSMVDACVTALEYPTALEAAQALTDGALRRWAVETQGVRCDDITVVVAFLPA
jgi:serine/threonine protein phosphatase PrpC